MYDFLTDLSESRLTYMTNTYGIYNSGSVVLEYWCGRVGAQELFQHQRLQEVDSGIADHATTIVDFREVIFDISDEEVVQFAHAFTQDIQCQKKRMALVICDEDWDRASLYAQQVWREDVEVIAFHTMEAACAWLNLDASNIESKINELKNGLLASA